MEANNINLTVKVFDNEKQEWEDLFGKSAVKALKEDFLAHKNEISLMKVPFEKSNGETKELFVPYDAEVLKKSGDSENSIRSLLSQNIVDDYTESLSQALDINTGYGSYLLSKLGIFDCIVETVDSKGRKNQIKGKNYEISSFELRNAKEFTVSYVFNDHAIPEKSFKYVKE